MKYANYSGGGGKLKKHFYEKTHAMGHPKADVPREIPTQLDVTSSITDRYTTWKPQYHQEEELQFLSGGYVAPPPPPPPPVPTPSGTMRLTSYAYYKQISFGSAYSSDHYIAGGADRWLFHSDGSVKENTPQAIHWTVIPYIFEENQPHKLLLSCGMVSDNYGYSGTLSDSGYSWRTRFPESHTWLCSDTVSYNSYTTEVFLFASNSTYTWMISLENGKDINAFTLAKSFSLGMTPTYGFSFSDSTPRDGANHYLCCINCNTGEYARFWCSGNLIIRKTGIPFSCTSARPIHGISAHWKMHHTHKEDYYYTTDRVVFIRSNEKTFCNLEKDTENVDKSFSYEDTFTAQYEAVAVIEDTIIYATEYHQGDRTDPNRFWECRTASYRGEMIGWSELWNRSPERISYLGYSIVNKPYGSTYYA